jgi:hypothetical protein
MILKLRIPVKKRNGLTISFFTVLLKGKKDVAT